jgi:transposase InsO family protein
MRLIGWAASNRMERDPAIRVQKMAISLRQPPKGCIHHADRGSRNYSHDYQKLLRQHGFQVSMNGTGIRSRRSLRTPASGASRKCFRLARVLMVCW